MCSLCLFIAVSGIQVWSNGRVKVRIMENWYAVVEKDVMRLKCSLLEIWEVIHHMMETMKGNYSLDIWESVRGNYSLYWASPTTG